MPQSTGIWNTETQNTPTKWGDGSPYGQDDDFKGQEGDVPPPAEDFSSEYNPAHPADPVTAPTAPPPPNSPNSFKPVLGNEGSFDAHAFSKEEREWLGTGVEDIEAEMPMTLKEHQGDRVRRGESDSWVDTGVDLAKRALMSQVDQAGETAVFLGGAVKGAGKTVLSVGNAINRYLSDVGTMVTGDKEFNFSMDALGGDFLKENITDPAEVAALDFLAGDTALNPMKKGYKELTKYIESHADALEMGETIGKIGAEIALTRFIPLTKPYAQLAQSTKAGKLGEVVTGSLREGVAFAGVHGAVELGEGATYDDALMGMLINSAIGVGAGIGLHGLASGAKGTASLVHDSTSIKRAMQGVEDYAEKSLAEEGISFQQLKADRVANSTYKDWESMPYTEKFMYTLALTKAGRKQAAVVQQDRVISDFVATVEKNTANAVRETLESVDSLTGTVTKKVGAGEVPVQESEVMHLLKNHGIAGSDKASYEAVEMAISGNPKAMGQALDVLDGQGVVLQKDLMKKGLDGLSHTEVNMADLSSAILKQATGKIASEMPAESQVLTKAIHRAFAGDVNAGATEVRLTPHKAWNILKYMKEEGDNLISSGNVSAVRYKEMKKALIDMMDTMNPKAGVGKTLQRLDDIRHARMTLLERNSMNTLLNADKASPAEIQSALHKLGMEDKAVYKQVLGNVRGGDRAKLELAIIRAKAMSNLEARARYSQATPETRVGLQTESKSLLSRVEMFDPADAVTKEGKELAMYLREVGHFTDGIVTNLPTMAGEKTFGVAVGQKINAVIQNLNGHFLQGIETATLDNAIFMRGIMRRVVKHDKAKGMKGGKTITPQSVADTQVFRAETINPETIFAAQTAKALNAIGRYQQDPTVPHIEGLLHGKRVTGLETMVGADYKAFTRSQERAFNDILKQQNGRVTTSKNSPTMVIEEKSIDHYINVTAALEKNSNTANLVIAPDASVNMVIGSKAFKPKVTLQEGMKAMSTKEGIPLGELQDISSITDTLKKFGVENIEDMPVLMEDLGTSVRAEMRYTGAGADGTPQGQKIVLNSRMINNLSGQANKWEWVNARIRHELQHAVDDHLEQGLTAHTGQAVSYINARLKTYAQELSGERHRLGRADGSTLGYLVNMEKAKDTTPALMLATINRTLTRLNIAPINSTQLQAVVPTGATGVTEAGKKLLGAIGQATGKPYVVANIAKDMSITSKYNGYLANMGEARARFIEGLRGEFKVNDWFHFYKSNKDSVDYLWRTGYKLEAKIGAGDAPITMANKPMADNRFDLLKGGF